MHTHTRKDEIILWQMYIHSGVRAIREEPEAEGITLLRTASGREYRFRLFRDDIPGFIDVLTQNGDTHVLYLVHVWKNHWLDVPSHDLRKALTALHPENENALLMLIGEENFSVFTIRETMVDNEKTNKTT